MIKVLLRPEPKRQMVPKYDGSNAITKPSNALLLCAMVAAKECALFLKAMADNSDTASRTSRSERVDGALEAVKGMGLAVRDELKGLIVVVSASLTFSHTGVSLRCSR